ncbi:GcrA cell cycle regulator [uncultured Caudovirales phage]|uniref:GcrA cell cycle regulator n=1 Tax=uncultured Caudovirales phage TaxID=2100421 RepID=A0A6J5M775_9CAUD|nr:GcrA cell cycle regulator [uncultured Caudovirales phage]
MSASLNTRWSAESITAIRTLANEGHTGREIGLRFGVSRNTIIGVCYRNAISLGGTGTLTQKRVLNANVPTLAQKRKEARQRRAVRLKAPEPQVQNCTSPRFNTAPEGVPLTDLTRNQCRWPVTTALPHRFCGAHADGTYCEHHRSRAYRGFE